MKKLVLLVSLLALPLMGADAIKTIDQNFRAGEVQVDVFGAMNRPDITGAPNWGAGVGVGYFITRGLGADLRISSYNWDRAAIDNGELRLLFRAPLWDKIAPYGFVEGFRNFDQDLWGAGAGGGLEYRLSKNLGVFGETGLNITTDGVSSWLTTFGTRLSF